MSDVQEPVSDKIFTMLTRDEGVQRMPYDDATGVPVRAPKGFLTIGVGHNLDSKPLSNAVIYQILSEDVAVATATAKDVVGIEVWDGLTENRKLALINLAFSMKPQSLRSFKKMLSAIRRSDWPAAGQELRESLWAKQVDPKCQPNQGRDDRVINLLEKDQYDY